MKEAKGSRYGKKRRLATRAAVGRFFRDPRFRELLGEDRALLVDVGAKGGVQDEWIPPIPLLEVIAFEPLWPADEELPRDLDIGDHPEPAERAKRKRFPSVSTLVPKALGGAQGTRTFHVLGAPTMSSFLRADRERWRLYGLASSTSLVRSIEVETTTLDAIVEERDLRFVDFVKLDTEGSELEILAGGERAIGELAFGLRVETAFVRLYEEQPLFADVDGFLRERGFEFIDFVHQKRLYRVEDSSEDGLERTGPGQVVQADPLYFRAPPRVAARLPELDRRDRARYLGGALIACLVYGRVDYALALVEVARPLLGPDIAGTARELVLSYARIA